MRAAQEPPSRGIETDVAPLRPLERDRAFERMYRRHASDVYRYALGVVRDAGDAEDVTQTTFLNAFRAFQRGERPLKAKSWLIAIAHNVCLQRFRNAARRPKQVAFDEDLAEALVPEESPSVDDLLLALRQLSFNQRSALVMRELEGRSYREIGELLDLPVSAVETLLFRARRALREQLETSITCGEAEELLSRQLDGRLPRSERGALRAHLRACEECARLARSQRAQRSAWKGLAFVPLPASLSSLFGGGGGAVATGMAAKVAAVGAAAVLVGGGTYAGVRVVEAQVHTQPAKHATVSAAPSARAARRATLRRPAPPAPVAAAPRKTVGKAVGREKSGLGIKRSGGPSAPAASLPPPRAAAHAGSSGQGRASAPGQLKKTAAGSAARAWPSRSRSARASTPRAQASKHVKLHVRRAGSTKAGARLRKTKGAGRGRGGGQEGKTTSASSHSSGTGSGSSSPSPGKKR